MYKNINFETKGCSFGVLRWQKPLPVTNHDQSSATTMYGHVSHYVQPCESGAKRIELDYNIEDDEKRNRLRSSKSLLNYLLYATFEACAGILASTSVPLQALVLIVIVEWSQALCVGWSTRFFF
jgi:hypothetical protein